MSDEDEKKVAEISQQLTALDVDSTSAQRIALAARNDLGRRRPRKWIEAIAVAVFTGGFLVWAVIKVLAAYR